MLWVQIQKKSLGDRFHKKRIQERIQNAQASSHSTGEGVGVGILSNAEVY
jgi:hypothetical protein